MRPYTVLIVDDEPTTREVVRRYLEHDGYAVREAEDGATALQSIRDDPPDLIVLDVMLPGLDGLSIARRLRDDDYAPITAEGNIPIVMLTARKSEEDRILGLELGADDYITKPFSPRELVARVKAVLRRTNPNDASTAERPLAFERLSIDPRTREVRRDGALVELTAREFDLLWFLARRPRQVFTRDQLLDQVWGYAYVGDDSTVTVHIHRLREKLEPDPTKPIFIQTVWGVGYKFEA